MGKKQGKQAKSTAEPESALCETEAIAVANTLPERVVALFRGCFYMRALAVLTVIGLLLRFYNLGYNSLWLDEASTLYFARQTLSGIWAATAGGEFNPPLFYWMEHVMLFFGDSEFVLRFIPALLGVLTIPVMYFVGATFRDKNTGIIAAALMTFSPFHIFYSQEARAYAPMLFFFALSLPFYIKALRTNDLRSWIVFGVLASLAFWTHFYAFVPIVLLLLFAAAFRIREVRENPAEIRNLAIGALAFALASLPLIIVTIGLFVVRTASAPTYGMQSLPVIYQTLLQISGYSEFVLAFFLILFAVGLWLVWRDNRKGAVLIVGMIVLPLIVSALLAGSMPMMPRYLTYLLPFWFVGIAASNQALAGLLGAKKTIYVFIAVIALISVPFYASYYTELQKNDWRGFSDELAGITTDGDVVVVLPGYMRQPLDYYYSNTTDGTVEYGATTSEDLAAIRDVHGDTQTFYVLTADIFAANPNGDALMWIEQNATPIRQNMGIYLFTS